MTERDRKALLMNQGLLINTYMYMYLPYSIGSLCVADNIMCGGANVSQCPLSILT